MGGVFGIAGRESVRVSEKGGGEKESRQKGSRASVLFMPDALAHSPGCRWSLCTCHPPRAGLTWFSFFGLFGLVWFGRVQFDRVQFDRICFGSKMTPKQAKLSRFENSKMVKF